MQRQVGPTAGHAVFWDGCSGSTASTNGQPQPAEASKTAPTCIGRLGRPKQHPVVLQVVHSPVAARHVGTCMTAGGSLVWLKGDERLLQPTQLMAELLPG